MKKIIAILGFGLYSCAPYKVTVINSQMGTYFVPARRHNLHWDDNYSHFKTEAEARKQIDLWIYDSKLRNKIRIHRIFRKDFPKF